MAIGQRKTSCTVIEDSRSPCGDCVARGTLRRRGWESGRNVVGHGSPNLRGTQKSRLMTTITVRRIQFVVVAQMAGGAGCRRWGHVRSSQRKTHGAVVECRCRPTCRRVACGTVRSRKCGAGC